MSLAGDLPKAGFIPLYDILLLYDIPLYDSLYVGQEATVRARHEKQTGSKLGKEYVKAVYCHPA